MTMKVIEVHKAGAVDFLRTASRERTMSAKTIEEETKKEGYKKRGNRVGALQMRVMRACVVCAERNGISMVRMWGGE